MTRPPRQISDQLMPTYTCRHCGNRVWQGLIWVHQDGESARCPSGETWAEPQVSWHPPGGFA